jgi:SnoaL-like polyketide cyclase
MSAEENMRLMKTLEDAWNSQDWDTFSKRHTEDVIAKWPGQTEPTRGLNAHRNQGVQMFKMFPKTIPIRCFSAKANGLARLPYSQVLTKVL